MNHRDQPGGDKGPSRDRESWRTVEVGGVRYTRLAPAKQGATYADIEALPPHVNGEIVDGELWVTPRPASPHAAASSASLASLKTRFDFGDGGPGGWHILHEPELHLGADVLIPDIAGWRVERLPVIENVPAFDLAPDWVCEVISPSTGRLDRTAKLRRYNLHGVEWIWILDPLEHSLEVYHRSEAGPVLVDAFVGEAPVRARPFDAVELEIGRWWLEPSPS